MTTLDLQRLQEEAVILRMLADRAELVLQLATQIAQIQRQTEERNG